MIGHCEQENCFPDTTCALGHLNRIECEYWKARTTSEVLTEEAATLAELRTSDVPWNGYALGTSDLAILSGRGQPLVIGLVGPPDSGKTSLLAIIYMWLLNHGRIGDWWFAGSWALGGWESVVQHCRWAGEIPPSFPPHTSSTGRHPGLLHAAFRHSGSGMLLDVVFTDAPGEWFTQWARAPGQPAADGARWVMNHSGVLLLLIDSAALADPEKLPQTRRATRDLIERLGASGACPVIVAWTKDDVIVPDIVRDTLTRAVDTFLKHAEVCKTTVTAPTTIEACFIRAMQSAQSTASFVKLVEPRRSTDPFLSFRGIHVGS